MTRSWSALPLLLLALGAAPAVAAPARPRPAKAPSADAGVAADGGTNPGLTAGADAGVQPAAAPDGKPQVLSLAITSFTGVAVSPELLVFFTEHFGNGLTANGVKVTTPAQMQAVLGLERQKQMLGCDEEQSCMAELANALGVDGIVTGQIAALGNVYRLNLRIVGAESGEVLSSGSAKAATQDELADELHRAAAAMSKIAAGRAKRTLGAARRPPPPPPPPSKQKAPPAPADVTRRDVSNVGSVTAMVAGGAVFVAGAALMTSALITNAALRRGDTTQYRTMRQAVDAETGAQSRELLSYPCLLVGGLVGGLGWLTYESPSAPAKATVTPLAGGAALVIEGAFP